MQHDELRATDCYFLGGFVRSNLSKPCAIPSITFLVRRGQFYFSSVFHMGGSRHKQGVRKGLEKNIQGQNRKGLALRSRTLHQL